MTVVSKLKTMTTDEVARAIAGLPETTYDVIVKPLRYRTEPHLQAITVFDDREITIQVPEPFLPFGDVVVYGAKRLPGDDMRFVPLSEGVSFRSRAEVVRFLYCHEWYHWFLYEVRRKGWMSETACDRFALRNFRRRHVTIDDAWAALRREREAPARAPSVAAPSVAAPSRPRVIEVAAKAAKPRRAPITLRLPGFDQ